MFSRVNQCISARCRLTFAGIYAINSPSDLSTVSPTVWNVCLAKRINTLGLNLEMEADAMIDNEPCNN